MNKREIRHLEAAFILQIKDIEDIKNGLLKTLRDSKTLKEFEMQKLEKHFEDELAISEALLEAMHERNSLYAR